MSSLFLQSVRTHIVHLSSAEALPTIFHLREQIGDRLTVETCHHYLTLASEDVPHGRVDFKCCPPIRDRYNREQLWKAIKSHDINMVVSDHSPSTAEVKLLNEGPDKGNFLKSWGGISSVQFGMNDVNICYLSPEAALFIFFILRTLIVLHKLSETWFGHHRNVSIHVPTAGQIMRIR